MKMDSRNRMPGTSSEKKRRFGRKKKRLKVFYKKKEPEATTLTTSCQIQQPCSATNEKNQTIPSTSCLKTRRTMSDILPTSTSAKTPTCTLHVSSSPSSTKTSTTDIPYSTGSVQTPTTMLDVLPSTRSIVEDSPSGTSQHLAQPQKPASKFKKKLTSRYVDCGPVKNRIFDISLLLPGLQEFLACKACGGDVRFSEVDIRGLGSKLTITCTVCNKATFIDSSRKVGKQNNAYEINRRAILTMRSLGHGHSGLSTLCGQMDFLPPVTHSNYDIINEELKVASDSVAKQSMSAAMQEDCSTENKNNDFITVSGDGSWRKRGHSSLQGVTTLIRNDNGKAIDVVAKQSFCKSCEMHPETDSEKYREWFEAHKEKCSANHTGSSGKMEVDGIIEMFQRSVSLHGVQYKNYIGDGDSKVYKSLCDAKPYGEDVIINKKECIGHVQKRMGTRLRNLKKSLAGQKLSDNKSIGGKDRLTAQRIDQLTRYYGNAIRSHSHSMEKMSNAIWATFYHKKSTDQEPSHHLCPPGSSSWCKWQVAKAQNQLHKFQHKDSFPAAIMHVIKPIYTDLTQVDLLQRCVGGFTQNSNESLNQSIWKLVPKHGFSGLTVLQIGVNIAVSSFNDGKAGVLEVMKNFSVDPGSSAVNWAKSVDTDRLYFCDRRATESTLEARRARRKRNHPSDDFYAPGGH